MKLPTSEANAEVRDILARIDTVFAAGSDNYDYYGPAARQARILWDILSALRGPDNVDNASKMATTKIIRAACFPKTYGHGNRVIGIPASMGYDGQEYATFRLEMGEGYSHFKAHARRAFSALGLNWYDVNKDETVDNVVVPKTPKATPRATAAFKARKARKARKAKKTSTRR